MKSLLIVLALLGSVNVGAAALPERATVKVYSGVCGGDIKKWRGSGILFLKDGAAYVVTSNHVLLNGNNTYCHSVENALSGNIPATLVASDWGIGLAVLKLASVPKIPGLPDYSRLFASDLKQGDAVTTAGFPYKQENLEKLPVDTGKVFNTRSDRHFFAHSFPMVELVNAHAEFGMSGGPVFGPASVFGGILSHQALMMVGSDISQVVDYAVSSEDGKIYNQVFVIPSKVVRYWLAKVFSPNFVPSLSEAPENQVAGIQRVYCNGLEFQFVSGALPGTEPGTSPTQVGGGHGSGVGGAHGSGVGGAHGSGVGGMPAASVAHEQAGYIQIKTSSQPEAKGNFLSSRKLEDRVKVIVHALSLGQTVTIPWMWRTEGLTQVAVPFTSLDEFFRLYARQDHSPLTLTTASESQTGMGEDDAPSAVKAVAKEAVSATHLLIGRVKKPELKVLLSQILIKAQIAASLDWRTIQVTEFTAMLDINGKNKALWYDLFDNERIDAIDLLQKVNRLAEELSRYIR